MLPRLSRELGCLALGACVALGATVWGQESGQKQKQGPGPGQGRPSQPAKKYLVVPGYWALGAESVQREIGLTPDQKSALKDLSDKYQSVMQRSVQSLQGLPQAEQQKRAAEVREQNATLTRGAQKKADAILTPQQVRMLQTIDFHLWAGQSLPDPRLQQEIGMSDAQREKLIAVYEHSSEQMQRLQRDTAERALGVLTPEQMKKLQQLQQQGDEGEAEDGKGEGGK